MDFQGLYQIATVVGLGLAIQYSDFGIGTGKP
jgi:hypothetical protein